ncbi:MAG: sulfite exporter TauE/SafE family protein [Planctomycetota bacterium]
MDWYWYALLVIAGFLAGIVNTIAGGGSFLTLPALIFICGLDPRLANGTNRIAILFSSLTATLTFRKHGQLDAKLALKLAVPTILGVLVGAVLVLKLPAKTFEPIFGSLFLVMAVVVLLNPKRLLEKRNEPSKAAPWLIYCAFFGIGVYVGFIQAGMGILLLIGMSLLNTGDLVASNAVKNLIGFVVTLAATLVFAFGGMIDWLPGLVVASGNIVGGIVGAKLAIKKGSQLIFAFLVVVMVLTGCNLIFDFF